VSAAFGTALPVGDEGEAGCADAGGCVCGTVVGAGLGACGVAMGVCGVPEEFFGSEEAGCCAQTQAVSKNNVAARNGERCICFFASNRTGRHHQFNLDWMQVSAAQMAGCNSKVKKLWPGYPT